MFTFIAKWLLRYIYDSEQEAMGHVPFKSVMRNIV